MAVPNKMTRLAIDVGNTTMSFGVFRNGRLAHRFTLPTHPLRSSKALAKDLRAVSAARRNALAVVERTIFCSVVPSATAALKGALRELTGQPVCVVGQDLHVPLTNRYTYPEQVGQDRLVGAYAAWKLYGQGRGAGGVGRGKDCIVCDFGTAITIDVVTKTGEYLGGIIAPGLDISLEVLATRTALLPQVELRKPPELLGRDTANSIRSGIVYGCAALCDGLVSQLKRSYAPNAVVVATGGDSSLITSYTHTIDHVKPHLVLSGLNQLSSVRNYPLNKS